MLALTLFRCSRIQGTNMNKIIFKNNSTKLLNFTPLVFDQENHFSHAINNKIEKSLLNSEVNTSLMTKRQITIPPRNKAEMNEFLNAFKRELFQFNILHFKSCPKTHLTYGAGGLAPFILPPLQMLMVGYSDGMAWVQLAYAATILSYLGGIQWGASIPDLSKSLPSWEAMGLSVAPQLVAWISILLPTPLGLITTSTALIATLAIDLLKHNYPPWFKSLRIFLTLGAVSSLIATLFGAVVA